MRLPLFIGAALAAASICIAAPAEEARTSFAEYLTELAAADESHEFVTARLRRIGVSAPEAAATALLNRDDDAAVEEWLVASGFMQERLEGLEQSYADNLTYALLVKDTRASNELMQEAVDNSPPKMAVWGDLFGISESRRMSQPPPEEARAWIQSALARTEEEYPALREEVLLAISTYPRTIEALERGSDLTDAQMLNLWQAMSGMTLYLGVVEDPQLLAFGLGMETYRHAVVTVLVELDDLSPYEAVLADWITSEASAETVHPNDGLLLQNIAAASSHLPAVQAAIRDVVASHPERVRPAHVKKLAELIEEEAPASAP
jgi:hypothetical protein